MRWLLLVIPFLVLAAFLPPMGPFLASHINLRSPSGLGDVEQKSAIYKATEAAKGFRASAFQDLALIFMQAGKRLSTEQAFEYLGYPDLIVTDEGRTTLIYRYNRTGVNDWALFLSVDGKKVKDTGINDWNASGLSTNPLVKKFDPDKFRRGE